MRQAETRRNAIREGGKSVCGIHFTVLILRKGVELKQPGEIPAPMGSLDTSHHLRSDLGGIGEPYWAERLQLTVKASLDGPRQERKEQQGRASSVLPDNEVGESTRHSEPERIPEKAYDGLTDELLTSTQHQIKANWVLIVPERHEQHIEPSLSEAESQVVGEGRLI
jgi:hypothetical protein